MSAAEQPSGRIRRISGSVADAETAEAIAMGEVLYVGQARLLGEAIGLDGNEVTIQIYEETGGLAPGDPVYATGQPLTVELGPGLLGAVFDGIQRPLEQLAAAQGDFLGRGVRAPALDRNRLWPFEPRVRAGDRIESGAVLGVVPETRALEHRVLVPPGVFGSVEEIARAETRRVADTVAWIRRDDGSRTPVALFHTWRVRAPRPFRARLPLELPLVTGQRVLDTFFPLPRGSAAGLPGGFGTGKTVLQQELCKWAEADVIVFVGCGERGNEMTRMLRELPELDDPRSGRPLAERTVLIANTSNMPVSAREASIYTGITIAEYYRDMGYHVAMLADSTSRWAEALREISGRLEEMPAEEGYPPYLASRLAAFYGRAGRVSTGAGPEGSVSLISAISPPGGDLTEPVTRHTQEFTRTFWSLDKARAQARVFPAVSVRDSYSDIPAALAEWWEREVGPDWSALRRRALALLEEADRIEGTARLVGSESLPERQRFLLRVASLFEEAFLRQSAYDPADAFCSPARQLRLLAALIGFCDRGLEAADRGVAARTLERLPSVGALERAKTSIAEGEWERFTELEKQIEGEIASAEAEAAALESAAS